MLTKYKNNEHKCVNKVFNKKGEETENLLRKKKKKKDQGLLLVQYPENLVNLLQKRQQTLKIARVKTDCFTTHNKRMLCYQENAQTHVHGYGEGQLV